MDSEVQMGRKQ